MEPDIRVYFKRIVKSIFTGLLWLVSNTTPGIMYDLAFVHKRVTLANFVYYAWFLLSLSLLLWYYVWIWRKPLGRVEEPEEYSGELQAMSYEKRHPFLLAAQRL